MKKINPFFYCLFFFISGCFDVCTPTKNISGPYFLMQSETGHWGLYYDLGGGSGHGRVGVDEIGWSDKYIFVMLDYKFYFIDKRKDDKFLNSDEIVIGPFDENRFKFLVDSLDIQNLKLRRP